ncbi:hypothetical protein M153_11990003195, partial [Pseudoloma neurophilia]
TAIKNLLKLNSVVLLIFHLIILIVNIVKFKKLNTEYQIFYNCMNR